MRKFRKLIVWRNQIPNKKAVKVKNPNAVARIGAESVCLLSGAGLLVRLENFRCLYAAITANPPPPRASPLDN
jgi:hypothetical protein